MCENMYIFLTHVIFYNIVFKGECYPQNYRIQHLKLLICRKSSKGKTGVKLSFKACVRYFLSNFHFSPNDNPSKTMENVFLFHLKSSFRS